MRLSAWSALALMTLSGCVSTNAAEHPDRKLKKHPKLNAAEVAPVVSPYTAFAWDSTTATLSNVQPMLIFSQVWVDPVVTANAMNALPEGRRVGLGFSMGDPLWGADTLTEADGTVVQSPWCDNGIKKMQSAFGNWFAKYTAAGGPQPDFVALDEERGFSAWGITAAQAAAIEADPRYPALAEVCGITDFRPGWFSPTWDNAMIALRNVDLSTAMNGLIKNVSNWGDAIVSESTSSLSRDLNGWPSVNTTILGNYQSPGYYGQIGQIAWSGRNDGTDPDFKNDLLATVIWQADQARVYAHAGQPSIPWFAGRSYAGDTGGPPVYIAGTPYWDEMVLHVLMSGGSTSCCVWNPNQTAADSAALNADLAALQKKCNGAPTISPIDLNPVPYNAAVLISGVSAGSRNVFRVTVQAISDKKQMVKVQLPGEKAVSTVTIPARSLGTWVVRE